MIQSDLRELAHLGAHFEVAIDAESDEVRVRGPHQNVVNAISMHVTDPVLPHVSQHAARV